jgi:CPA2 family monovalent cation:H+ antiporter-2
MESILLQATIYLAAAVIAVPIAARLGLGSVLGYLIAGLVIGPVLGLIGHESHDLMHVAEFGVVMMLFLIGLELEPRTVWDMRHRLVGLGGLQIGVTTAAVLLAVMILGQSFGPGLAIGLTLALSSTAIVLQTLSEKGLMQTGGGRSAFAVLLTQDIAVIPMLVLVPLLAVQQTAVIAPDGSILRLATPAADAHGTAALIADLPGWAAALVTLGMVGAVILGGIYLTRPVFRFIHASRLHEMYTALALLIVVGISVLMAQVGLSPALGAFLAGMVLANSEFRHELESDIEPFKGLLLGLFFITVGAGMDVEGFLASPLRLLALTFGLMALKGAVLFLIGRAFGLRGRDQWLFTLGLAQAGEFGFVLVSFSLQTHVLTERLAATMSLVIALSMLFTPLFFMLYDLLSKLHRPAAGADPQTETIEKPHEVIIAGIGRFGKMVNQLVRSAGFKTTVLDNDLTTIELMRKFGVKSFFGDPTRPQVLKAAGLATAKVLVVAVSEPASATRIVKTARKARPDLHIVARARDDAHVYELFKAGADDIVRETFDASLRAGRYVLENIGLSDYEAHEAEVMFYHHDREVLAELAELWDPKKPVDQNPAYIRRVRELEKDLEAALLLQLSGTGETPPGRARSRMPRKPNGGETSKPSGRN